MNMALRLPEDLRNGDLHDAPVPLCDFARAHAKPLRPPGRIFGAVAVLAGHVALIAAILWSGSQVYNIVVPPQPITVALLAETPKAETPPPPPLPKLVNPEIPVVMAPEITIATQPPKAITVQQVKTPPAPAAPISGTGKDVYLAHIIAALDAAKQYPPQARRLHMEGVVQLHFIMNRAGHVLSFDIAKSSGRTLLDNEAKAMIARAQPLPPIPADWPQTTLNLVVPVEFELH